MTTNIRRSLIAAAALSLGAASSLAAQGSAAPATSDVVAPDVGQMAPDFAAAWGDASGAKATPVSLKQFKGKVVVLAFYPLDRSSGCTAELSAFRDQYDKLFGKDVVVLPVSIDSVGSHVSWARDAKFPFGLISDPDMKLATMYGSNGAKYAKRTIFVIGKDGKITYRDMKFGALSQDAYDRLTTEVAKAKA